MPLAALRQKKISILIILNQLYCSQNNSIEPSTESKHLADLVKVSLLPIHEKGHQEQEFRSLIENQPLYFRKTSRSKVALWEIYVDCVWADKVFLGRLKKSRFDFLMWPEACLTPPQLMVFDMDSTFIKIEVIDELARRHGVGESVSKVTESAMRGELDFAQSLISRVACLRGLSASTIGDICQKLPLSDGVERLMEYTKRQAVDVAIVSGGFSPFVSHLKQTMGLYQVKANQLEIEEGKLTGKVHGQIVDAAVKADFVQELINELRLTPNDVITVGDGANDLLMMNESGFNLAYRAKPAVQDQAKGRFNYSNLDRLVAVFGW